MLHQTFLKKKGTFKYRAKTSDAKNTLLFMIAVLRRLTWKAI